MIRRLIYLLVFVILAPALAYATDTICGVDTDGNGTYGLACTGISDADRDGIVTSSDCDDSNRFIVPGVLKDFSGTLKICEANGTWTTVGAWPSGVLAGKAALGADDVKFVGPSGSTTDNTCGAHDNPCDYRCFSTSNGLGCSQTLSAGTWVMFLTGNYTGYYTATDRRQIYLSNVDGTSGHEIQYRGVLGQPATITGQGDSTHPVNIADFPDSNYIQVWNLELTGGVGGFGIRFASGTHDGAYANHVHNFANYHDDNHAGIILHADATASQAKWNLVHDITYGTATDKSHSNQILIEDVDAYVVDYNVVYCDGTDCRGIIDKHAAGGATNKEIIGNVVYDVLYQGIIAASHHDAVYNNYVQNTGGSCFAVLNVGGGDHEFGDIVIKNNTCNGSWPIEFVPEGSPTADTWALEIRDNIFVDDRASSYGGDGANGFFRFCHYCSDTLRSDFIGKIYLDNNGIHNLNSIALFETSWGADQGAAGDEAGASYTNCSSIVAGTPSHTNTPCTGNAGTDPGLNSMQVATTTGLTDAGWNINWPGVSTSTTTSTTSTTSSTTTTSRTTTTTVGGSGTAVSKPKKRGR